jgi:copper chaperone CopZ
MVLMDKICLKIDENFCADCSLALQRFIGGMEGVNSIGIDSGNVVIEYDEKIISGGLLYKVAVENVRKLGYKVLS